MYHSGSSGRTEGVALLLNNNVSQSLTQWTPVSNRILHARLPQPTGPPIQSTPPHDQQLVIGDINAVSGKVRAGY